MERVSDGLALCLSLEQLEDGLLGEIVAELRGEGVPQLLPPTLRHEGRHGGVFRSQTGKWFISHSDIPVSLRKMDRRSFTWLGANSHLLVGQPFGPCSPLQR